MKPLFRIVIAYGCVLGCTESSPADSPSADSSSEFNDSIAFIMVNKAQCDLQGDSRETTVEDIVGVWVDSLMWKNRRPDTCWYGVKSLDKHLRFEAKSSRVFIWEVSYSVGVKGEVDIGEFFLTNDSSGTVLGLARNISGDTLFAVGDTMMGREMRLYWNGKDRLLLVPDRFGVPDDDYEVYDMVRVVSQ